LKLGHVPTANNVNYVLNWTDAATKKMKSFQELQQLYEGIDPNRAVIAYCHSARRGSFGYFVLRLMGFADVLLYEPSWMEWGSHRYYYPVETAENILKGGLPTESTRTSAAGRKPSAPRQTGTQTDIRNSSKAKSGYISCGG
jgi:thiosulfate/3-mercaptopyruvate sulfurtransferase